MGILPHKYNQHFEKNYKMEKLPEISEIRTVNESSSEILSIKWSPDDLILALGCSDGRIKLYSTENYRIVSLIEHPSSKNMPITSVCWRPGTSENGFSSILLSTCSDGWVVHWLTDTVSIYFDFRLTNEQCLSVDYSPCLLYTSDAADE